jgi:hypothetical protein
VRRIVVAVAPSEHSSSSLVSGAKITRTRGPARVRQALGGLLR